MSRSKTLILGVCLASQLPLLADHNVFITEVPDYSWYAGCFGTASGNLMGYWDRHGFPNFYTGPTAAGIAPLDSNGANQGIRSLWVSKAGFDGKAINEPGHIDDYWTSVVDDSSYESTSPDPYVTAGRKEHMPDCICDFMGSSQNKWTDLDGECSGNIDAFSFNFWDKEGHRRDNFTPVQNGEPIRDIQSGWRAWTESRGNRANVFSQLADVNPNAPAGTGFTFEDLKAEIDAGYPLMLFLQNPDEFSRPLANLPRANPHVHGMIAYGYVETDAGDRYVRYRTSWASGDFSFAAWGPQDFEAGLALRGIIGFRPLPQIKSISNEQDGIHVQWDGPASLVQINDVATNVHWYVLERSSTLDANSFVAVTAPSPNLQTTLPMGGDAHAFYRVRLVTPPQ